MHTLFCIPRPIFTVLDLICVFMCCSNPPLGRRACRVQLQSGIAAEPYGPQTPLGRTACRVQLQSGLAAEPYGPPTPLGLIGRGAVKGDRNVNVRARLGRFYINLLGPDIVRGLLGRPRLQSEFAGGDLLECKSPPANTNRRGAARVGNSQVHSGLAGVQVRSGLARLPTARSVLLVCGGLGFARVGGARFCSCVG